MVTTTTDALSEVLRGYGRADEAALASLLEVSDWERIARQDLSQSIRVNGAESLRFPTNAMLFGVARYISTITRYCTLYPGDVIGSGTVGTGCLLELTAGQGPWLEPDDLVELEISGLGVLKNRIIP